MLIGRATKNLIGSFKNVMNKVFDKNYANCIVLVDVNELVDEFSNFTDLVTNESEFFQSAPVKNNKLDPYLVVVRTRRFVMRVTS